MIYLITGQSQLHTEGAGYKLTTIEEVERYLSGVEEASVDTETTGLDAHRDKLHTLQIGDYYNQYIIDASTTDITRLKPYLEERLLLIQNAKFDLKFLYKYGIYPRKVWDTFVTERVLYCGIPDHKAGLDSLVQQYCNITLDKSVQKTIAKEGLVTKNLQYMADDIKYLSAIRDKQLVDLRKKYLKGTSNLENKFVPVLAYIEYCGMKLNVPKWTEKMITDKDRMNKARITLDNWILNKGIKKFIEVQGNLFDPPGCTVNWSSPKQVVDLLEHLGVNCTIVEKGKEKKSVEASVIEKQKNEFEIISLYLEYKKAEKIVGTYGENFIRQINPVTGRIHTKFTQIMDTGRMSSGGKDRATKEEFINFQNIPSDPETRSCFIAEPGSTLVVSDYSGQEQIVLANRCLDKNLLKFYDEGLADMHSFVASKMYPELEGLDLDEIKKLHKDKRQAAKSAGFAINYGGSGITIADNLGISKEDGDRIYNAYFQAFPGLSDYFKKVKQQGLNDGYILISPITGRKSYIYFFDRYKELEAQTKGDFWERYREAKKTQSKDWPELSKTCREYFQLKGEIERMTLNYPIQGSSADVTKIACVYFYNWIINNNYFWTVKIPNVVHDEVVAECPVDLGEEVSQVLHDTMGKAGDIYCKRVPLKADPELTSVWKK
jgi:DNA polymerase-1